MNPTGPTRTILVVDDEARIRQSIVTFLQDEGYETLEASSTQEAAALLDRAESEISLVLLDVWLGGDDGIAFLESRNDLGRTMSVVVMSGHGNIDMAVRATRLGAFDFLEKPVTPKRLIVTIDRALDMARLKQERDELRGDPNTGIALIGESPAMKSLRSQVARVAPTPGKVLILGENGTGKELVARQIHELSDRRDFPFVRVNSAAIPRDLVESELFGHEKGAFTGATAARKGKMELAHRGTLFLDEIGDMSLDAQAKLLRAIESGEVERLGGQKTLTVDVRLVAATNKDLRAEMEAGRFREDLYFRLNVVPILVQPLRERRSDIPLLVRFFLEKLATASGHARIELLPESMDLLEAYDWPGNVRELRNVVERILILSESRTIDAGRLRKMLPELSARSVRAGHDPATSRPPAAGGGPAEPGPGGDPAPGAHGGNPTAEEGNAEDLRAAVENAERRVIREAIETAGGNMSEAARRLGIDRANLYRKMKKYEMERDEST